MEIIEEELYEVLESEEAIRVRILRNKGKSILYHHLPTVRISGPVPDLQNVSHGPE